MIGMDKLIKFIFDIVIAILLMFGTVLIYFGLRTESVVRTMDSMITEEFLTRIKKDGHLHHREYEDYLHRLSFTGTIYELQFEHKYNIWEPHEDFGGDHGSPKSSLYRQKYLPLQGGDNKPPRSDRPN
jgi:hypothetical protein